MNLAGIGAVLSGVGSLAGGFGFGSSKGKSPDRQLAENMLSQAQHLRWAAKIAKIHPLSMLGISPSASGESYRAGSNVGQALEGVGDAFTRYGQQKIAQQQLVNQTNVSDAQAEESRSRAKLADAQRAKLMQDIVTQSAAASLAQRAGQKTNQTGQAPEAIVHPLGSFVPGPHTPAERMEQEYGGAAGEMYGLSRLLGEYGQDLGREYFDFNRRRNLNQRFEEWTDYDSRTAP